MRGSSDTEILAWVASVGGTHAFLEQAFSSLSDAFRTQRSEPESAVIEWDIRTPDEGVVGYRLAVDHGECRIARGGSLESAAVVAVDMANFVRLLIGELDSGEAVSAGTLQVVTGDSALANLIRVWFDANPQRPQ